MSTILEYIVSAQTDHSLYGVPWDVAFDTVEEPVCVKPDGNLVIFHPVCGTEDAACVGDNHRLEFHQAWPDFIVAIPAKTVTLYGEDYTRNAHTWTMTLYSAEGGVSWTLGYNMDNAHNWAKLTYDVSADDWTLEVSVYEGFLEPVWKSEGTVGSVDCSAGATFDVRTGVWLDGTEEDSFYESMDVST